MACGLLVDPNPTWLDCQVLLLDNSKFDSQSMQLKELEHGRIAANLDIQFILKHRAILISPLWEFFRVLFCAALLQEQIHGGGGEY